MLVTGGVRSGKSRHAETLLRDAPDVTYLAPGPPLDDPAADADWAERIAAHRAVRPAGWTTLETHDLAGSLSTEGPMLVDCLGTWLTAVLDEHAMWEAPVGETTALVRGLVEEAVTALERRSAATVLVTNEVGLGVVPTHRSGRLFRDLLGLVNQELAAVCDEVHLVIAGRVMVL